MPRYGGSQQGFGSARLHGRRELVVQAHPCLPHFRCPSRIEHLGKHPEEGTSDSGVVSIDHPVPHVPGAQCPENPVEFRGLVQQGDGPREHVHQLFRLGLDLRVEHRPERRVDLEQVLVEDECGDAGMRFDHGKARPQEMDLVSLFETHGTSIAGRRCGAIPTLVGTEAGAAVHPRPSPAAIHHFTMFISGAMP